VLAGCFTGDLALIGRSLRDVVVEPHRAALIPGFAAVQAAAMREGALGCSISGGGPSVFAWCDGDRVAHRVRHEMMRAFGEHRLETDAWISPVDGPGARLEAVS
jgi:homoserine kinase